MVNEIITIKGYRVQAFSVNTLIIGSGAASLNAALSLHQMGMKDILIATSKWNGGTSRNAGSDKQTYYKLSLSGDEPDSVPEMAKDLFNGRCMHGDIALCEAQGSVQAFLNLVRLGVPFPHDKYGSWAGYKTDHDPRSRATSAGPWTSKLITEALAGEVRKRRIKVLDHHHVIRLLTDREKTRVTGVLAINTKEKEASGAFVLFSCENIILGTGGPAGIYETSVYPQSQAGSTGMAFSAGAAGQNLTESQFGIASVKFRWNLSGSYQQVLPKYISTNASGGDRKEFLAEYFPGFRSLTKAVFLKGYQWPFDPARISDHGSSLIDLLVHREITVKRRKVFLDYTANPLLKPEDRFPFDQLDPLVYEYLKNSGALKERPVERLRAMNIQAYELFRSHGIDLEAVPLQIAVCAQHNNGGLKGNIWWESNLKHLFPVGEVNGSHGVYRPGGSALNSGQTGSYRAAMFISRNYRNDATPAARLIDDPEIADQLKLAEKWLARGRTPVNRMILQEIRKRMSDHGGIIRSLEGIRRSCGEAEATASTLNERIGAGSVRELAEAFLLSDHCLTHRIYLEAIKIYLENGGRSRGSYIVSPSGYYGDLSGKIPDSPELCMYDRDIENKILEIRLEEGKIKSSLTEVREIPGQDLWFEKVWKEYLQDNSGIC